MGIPISLKKSFHDHHSVDSYKNDVKVRGLRQGLQKGTSKVDLFIIKYFPGFRKCIFDRFMIVKTIIFFSVPVIFGSAGDSISSSSLLYITRFHAWLNIRRNFPAIFITAWETNVIQQLKQTSLLKRKMEKEHSHILLISFTQHTLSWQTLLMLFISCFIIYSRHFNA